MGLASELRFGENPLQFKATFHLNNNVISVKQCYRHTNPSGWLTSYGIFIKLCGRNKAGGEENYAELAA